MPMTSTGQMKAMIALADALQHIEEADALLRPVTKYLLDQADTECDLQIPDLDH